MYIVHVRAGGNSLAGTAIAVLVFEGEKMALFESQSTCAYSPVVALDAKV